jgi:hypothetical protein
MFHADGGISVLHSHERDRPVDRHATESGSSPKVERGRGLLDTRSRAHPVEGTNCVRAV